MLSSKGLSVRYVTAKLASERGQAAPHGALWARALLARLSFHRAETSGCLAGGWRHLGRFNSTGWCVLAHVCAVRYTVSSRKCELWRCQGTRYVTSMVFGSRCVITPSPGSCSWQRHWPPSFSPAEDNGLPHSLHRFGSNSSKASDAPLRTLHLIDVRNLRLRCK